MHTQCIQNYDHNQNYVYANHAHNQNHKRSQNNKCGIALACKKLEVVIIQIMYTTSQNHSPVEIVMMLTAKFMHTSKIIHTTKKHAHELHPKL